jgi:Xaa-Pro aminopeptidase
MVNNRSPQARQILRTQGLDALVFFSLPNIRYLCGFTGSDGALVVHAGGECFLTDSRYTTQARQQVAAGEIRQYRAKEEGVLAYLQEHNLQRIGFEAETLCFATVERLREQGSGVTTWIPLTRELADLRTLKTAEEIVELRRAARLNAAGFEEILPLIRPGVSEKEIALALEFALKRRGGEDKAFDFIVASGVRGAMPHGVATEKILAAGELVTIDFGTRVSGYHSDETVTLAVGEVAPRLREIYDIVLAAHDRALAAVRPGVALKEIDATARDYIAGCGYGDYFGHGLGHGVGLEVHEAPTVSPRSEAIAAEGMVFTIEPGIYVPDLGGVRIEDTIEVTADGCRLITCLPKEFRTLSL